MSLLREEPKEPPRQASAEGLRGFAALNVVLCHFVYRMLPNLLSRVYPNLFPDPQSPSGDSLVFKIAESPPASLLYNGNFAVSIFFALSGYVLVLPWHQQQITQETLPQVSSSWSSSSSTTTSMSSMSSSSPMSSSSCCSTSEQLECVLKSRAHAHRVLRRRLWGRFLRLHIPAAASMIFTYVIMLAGAYEHTKTTSRPEITSYWKRFPANVSFKEFVSALLGGELLHGMFELNPVMWTLRREFYGSVVVLLYTLAVEPAPCLPAVSSSLFCSTHPERTQEKARVTTPATGAFESLKRPWASLVSNVVTTPTPSDSSSFRDRRTWWLRTTITSAFTILLVSSVFDPKTTFAITVMLLGAHVPSMPRLSKRAAWSALALAAYLGAFQYDRAIYFSMPNQRFRVGKDKGNDTSWDATPVRHPMMYVFGGRIPANHVFHSAAALLAVLSIVHSGGAAAQFCSSRFAMYLGRVSFPVYLVHWQVLVAVGGNLFFMLPETILGSPCVPLAIIFFAYIVLSYGLASTIFLAIDKKAISISRAVTVRLL